MTQPLTAADRCGAQAYVRVILPVGELLFCAHHAREHAPKFAALATHVQDETDRLLAEHGAGAGAAPWALALRTTDADEARTPMVRASSVVRALPTHPLTF